MSKTMVLYLLSVLLMWLPASLAIRRSAPDGARSERVIGAALLAVVWPLALPALSLSRVVAARSQTVSSSR